MQSPEMLSVALGAVRDQLIAVLAQHEKEAHGGAACMGNRASSIGYLAHCLGVREDAWDYAKLVLDEHDANCRHTDCGHGER